jgi:hypothetical protein
MAKVNAFMINVDEGAEWSRCAGAVEKSLHYARPLKVRVLGRERRFWTLGCLSGLVSDLIAPISDLHRNQCPLCLLIRA